MTAIADAFMIPGARIDRRTTGFGVYGPDGRALSDTAIVTSSWHSCPAEQATPPYDAPRLFGPALFCGSVDKQFGFVLLNSLGRLWALDGLPPHTTVVYAAKPQAKAQTFALVPIVLRSLGLQNPIVVTEGAMRFEAMHTAEERFGECLGGTGTAAFYDWLDSRLPATGPVDPSRKLYVTRTGLGPQAGRFACEAHLEALLKAEGYEIYAPEAHPLTHQIATFRSAGRLIFAEGSAVHLFALLRKPGQVSAVILRRPSLPEVMVAQMSDREGSPTIGINVVQDIWWPPQRGEHLGLSVLDFDRLRDALVVAGLISGRSWSAPDSAEVAESLRAGLAPDEHVMNTAQRAEWLKVQREARRKG